MFNIFHIQTMNPILNRDQFIIKEPCGLFKINNNYNICDPKTNETIIEVKEVNTNIITKFFSFNKGYKQTTPFDITFNDKEHKPLLRVKRGWVFFSPEIKIFDQDNELIGRLSHNFLSVGGRFKVYDKNNDLMGKLNVKWYSGEFTFTKEGQPLGKKEANKWDKKGTTPYNVNIDPRLPKDAIERKLILASIVL